MKSLVYLFCAAVLVGFLTAPVVAVEVEDETETLTGKIVSVKDGKVTVMPKDGVSEEDQVIVETTEDTKVTVDGEEAEVSDLEADMKVVIVHKDKVAESIAATKPKAIMYE